MKLSNKKLVDVIEGIGNIVNMTLPVKVSYAILKNVTKIEKELEIYHKERERLVAKYGEKKESGNLKISEDGKVNIEDVEGWNKEFNELLNIKVDIDIHKFKIDEIMDCNMSVVEIALIDFMIKK